MSIKLKVTDGQFRELMRRHIGCGFLALRVSETETMSVEFCVGRNGHLVRVADGKPVFPLTIHDEDYEAITVTAPSREE